MPSKRRDLRQVSDRPAKIKCFAPRMREITKHAMPFFADNEKASTQQFIRRQEAEHDSQRISFRERSFRKRSFRKRSTIKLLSLGGGHGKNVSLRKPDARDAN